VIFSDYFVANLLLSMQLTEFLQFIMHKSLVCLICSQCILFVIVFRDSVSTNLRSGISGFSGYVSIFVIVFCCYR